MWMLLIACFGRPDPDTGGAVDGVADGAAADGGVEEAGPGCVELEFGYDGPDPPAVGDTWVVWPICDGAMATSMIVLIDPIQNASVSANAVTFDVAGPVTVTLRYGSQRVSKEVEVSEVR